ncbi:acyl-CoA synthetase [Jatrophihabitans sp. GAS493]|uniref:acyl-CoA synthetase n=1 Tax=Jatrophihabitans sp. GAS493 TaxID=1907575 RepID=UPI001F53ACE2|nr:acyl-CoA synthetase [Jatrophihabitans sp. GAS493]
MTDSAHNAGVLVRRGIVPLRLDHGLQSLIAMRRLGPVAGAAAASAMRHGDHSALADERGVLTYGDLDRRSNALARAWMAAGVNEKSVVAVLCRDHRGLVDSIIASAKVGAKLLLMNTGFSKPQLADVAAREGVNVIVYDEEFTDLLSALPANVTRYLGWQDVPGAQSDGLRDIESLIQGTDDAPVAAPPKDSGGLVLLTSGTTGTPKGAPRQVTSPLAAAYFLERIPLGKGEPIFIAAPLFHATGFSQFIMAFSLGAKLVVRRRFDPEATMAAMAEHRCTALVAVPTMLQRMADLPDETIKRYDLSPLRIIFLAGSALSPELGQRVTALWGDVIHNLYGSTEVAVISVATPQDWREAPGTVGYPPHGCTVRLYDENGKEIKEVGAVGRIFAGSSLAFGGYTDGGNKQIIDGLLSSGDVGHFDEKGRLFVDGRDDDMIVSGGENVFPLEVENLLISHPDVLDVSVLGVEDDAFGQRLAAFIVLKPDAKLDDEGARAFVKENLARYKVPRDVRFLEKLPRNATGKVLKNELRALDV